MVLLFILMVAKNLGQLFKSKTKKIKVIDCKTFGLHKDQFIELRDYFIIEQDQINHFYLNKHD